MFIYLTLCHLTSILVFFQLPIGVLNGPDIRRLMKSESFTNVLDTLHRKAWFALRAVIENVLGKNRAEQNEAKAIVQELLKCYRTINASMTLKLHFLHFHLEEFLRQLPTESDEQGERFHQTTMPMEKRYKGKKLDALLAEVCWWSQKIYQYENEDDTEQGGHSEIDQPIFARQNEGHSQDDLPLNPLSSDSDIEAHDDAPQAKRSRPSSRQSTSKNSMETESDTD